MEKPYHINNAERHIPCRADVIKSKRGKNKKTKKAEWNQTHKNQMTKNTVEAYVFILDVGFLFPNLEGVMQS